MIFLLSRYDVTDILSVTRHMVSHRDGSIMREKFANYARTFCQLCANYAPFLPIMRTFSGFVLHMNVPLKITIFEFRYTGVYVL